MAIEPRPRRNNLGFAIVLIALGIVLLVMIRRPDFDPWTALERYWPLILIFIGLGKLLDHLLNRNRVQVGVAGSGSGSSWISGTAIALVALIGIFAIVARGAHPFRFSDHIVGNGNPEHSTQMVEKQGADSVTAKIDMPAGELTIDGGGTQLLDAGFDYTDDMEKPSVSYTVNGKIGRLDISQHERRGIHLGGSHENWNLKFGDTPMELEIQMGAGEGHLNFQRIDLSRLRVEAGVGNFIVDLTGERKRNLTADIQGGVGNATIHLPNNVGVQVHASGGIGNIDRRGNWRTEGDGYVNDAYGKSPVTIRLNAEGGVGNITLILER
jgi:hypothetical protein